MEGCHSCKLYVQAARQGCSLFPRPPTDMNTCCWSVFTVWNYVNHDLKKFYLNLRRRYVHNFVVKLLFRVCSVEFNHSKPSCSQNLGAVHRDVARLTGHHLCGGWKTTESSKKQQREIDQHHEVISKYQVKLPSVCWEWLGPSLAYLKHAVYKRTPVSYQFIKRRQSGLKWGNHHEPRVRPETSVLHGNRVARLPWRWCCWGKTAQLY